MNPIFAQVRSLAEPLERILLELSDFQRAHLVIAVADDKTLRHEAMAELGERLSGRCLLRDFDFSHPPQRSLPRFCRTLINQHPFCVFAYGLEKLLMKSKQAEREGKTEEAEQSMRAYDESLAFLNMHREDIALSKASVVLWVTTEIYTDLLSKAGDFWAWRTADVRFELPSDVSVRPTALGQLSLEDAEDLRRQARQIEEILNRPNHPNPAVVADLQQQLSEIRKQLGQEKESKELHEKAISTLSQLGDDRRLREIYYQRLIAANEYLNLRELYCQRLIANNEYLDFRGILQVREILRLRLEDLYVPLWATTEATQRILSRELAEAQRISSSQPPFQPSLSRSRIKEIEAEGAEINEALLHELTQAERLPERRVEIAQVLREHQRLVVLGDPGTGKSTLLKLLSLTFARGRESVREKFQLDEDRLPLLIPIAAYGEAVTKDHNLTFANFLCQRLAADGLEDRDVIQRALERGECILLLDGLDEVLDLNTRIQVSRQIERFISDCDLRNRVVVTSRIAGYQRVGFTGDFAHLTLLPFDDEEIKVFARNWACAYESSPKPTVGWERRAEQRAEQLTEAILSTPAVRRLAANPLLVTILALIQQQGTRLPHQRVELYRLCVEALAEHWQRARSLYRPIDLYLGTRRLDEHYIIGTLAPIAFWLFENRPTGLLHRTELEQQIAERMITQEGIKEINALSLAHEFVELIREQSGLLIERGVELFDFLHPTFKEYLAARHLAERRDPLKLLDEHLFASRWREVVLLTAGILKGDYLDDFLNDILEKRSTKYDDILHRPLFLAFRCLADDVSASAPLRRQILDEVFKLWPKPPFQSLRRTISDLFTEAKGSRIAEELATRIVSLASDKEVSALVRRYSAQALGQLGERSEKVINGLLSLASDKEVSALVRRYSAQALGQLGEREKAAQILLSLASDKEEDARVRHASTKVLGELGKREEATQILLSLAQDKEVDAWVRRSSAEALGELGEQEKAAQIFLSLVQDEKIDSRERFFSLRALGELRERSKRVMIGLLSLAQDEELDVWVRYFSTKMLGELGEREKAAQILLSLAQDEKLDAGVRCNAAEALGELGDRSKRIVIGLLSLVQDEKLDAGVRCNAAEALGKLGDRVGEREKVAQILLSLAQDKKVDVWVRRTSAQILGELGEKGKAAQILLSLAQDKKVDALVRRFSTLELGELRERSERVVSGLLSLVRNKKVDRGVRFFSTQALGQLGQGDKNVLDALAQIVRTDRDLNVRNAAWAALLKLANIAADEPT